MPNPIYPMRQHQPLASGHSSLSTLTSDCRFSKTLPVRVNVSSVIAGPVALLAARHWTSTRSLA